MRPSIAAGRSPRLQVAAQHRDLTEHQPRFRKRLLGTGDQAFELAVSALEIEHSRARSREGHGHDRCAPLDRERVEARAATRPWPPRGATSAPARAGSWRRRRRRRSRGDGERLRERAAPDRGSGIICQQAREVGVQSVFQSARHVRDQCLTEEIVELPELRAGGISDHAADQARELRTAFGTSACTTGVGRGSSQRASAVATRRSAGPERPHRRGDVILGDRPTGVRLP